MSLNVDLLKGDRSWESQAQFHNFERNQHYQRRLASVEREQRRRMENSTYLPTSLQSPALMVLASTAEASRDAAMHMAAAGQQHHFSPGGAMEGKELHVPFTASSFSGLSPALYAQPHEGFHNLSAAHLLHMHAPFLAPNMDRALGFINPTGGGAFRPVAAERNGFHSAFMPASKCPKMDQNGGQVLHHRGLAHLQRLGAAAAAANNNGLPKAAAFGSAPGGCLSPVQVKDEGSSDHDTSSSDYAERFTETPLSDVTDATERSTPDETRMKNRAKKRSLFDGQSPCCPVCGVTLRCGEFDVHFAQEVDRLAKISRVGRKSSKDGQPKSSGTPTSTSNNNNKKSKESPNQALDKAVSPEARWDSYQRVRTNRQSRLSARSKVKKRRHVDETVCPICGERLSGTSEELNAHAESCIRKRELHGDEDEPVDVEGESYEEYEWAGQTRIRATTLLRGGFSASGFQTSNSQNHVDEDDIDLNVDGDDSATYGHAQYGEADVIPCSCDEPGEDEERHALRGAVLTGASTSQQHIKMESDNWPERYAGSPHDSENNDNLISSSAESYQNPMSTESAPGLEKIIESLKTRLRQLEENEATTHDCNASKCRICMESFNVPLVSVSCWHVHCEECWLRTLGAKKLCPQCNMITSPSDLRRLYL